MKDDPNDKLADMRADSSQALLLYVTSMGSLLVAAAAREHGSAGPQFSLAEVLSCMKTDAANPMLLPQKRKDALFGNSWAENGGRLMYCVMRQKAIISAADFFAGYPGTGAPFVLATANKWKHEHNLPWQPTCGLRGKPYTRSRAQKAEPPFQYVGLCRFAWSI